MKQAIAVVVIAKNEESRIIPCLESVAWCNEIVVVDDMSTDDTAQICRRFKAKVVAHSSNGNHDMQRNIGIDNANSDWILQLDADERVTPQLKKDIGNILEANNTASAYKIGRRNYFLRRFMRYGGWYERHIRLFKKGKARYIGHSVHETLKVDGAVKELDSYLDHYAFDSIRQYIDRQLYYAGVESRVMYEDRGRIDLKEVKYHLMIRPPKLFFKLFIKKQGVKDGMHGFIFSILNAWRHFIIWVVYWEKYYKRLELRFPVNQKVEVDIVMPISGELGITKKCIESIIRLTRIPIRLIVIDNNSDLDTKTYLNNLKSTLGEHLKVIENKENVGWIKAINQGIKNSEASYICIMNNDVIVAENWLKNMYKIARDNLQIGLVNPIWEKRDLKEYRFGSDYIETDWCRGFCILIKKEVIEKIGYFDEIFGFGYWDDHDYSIRAIDAGYICVRSLKSFVNHVKNVTFKKQLMKERWEELFEINQKIFEKKWGVSKRLILAINHRIFRNKHLLQEMLDKAIEFARKQHKVYIFSSIYSLKVPRHTNIRFVRCLPVFFGLDIKIRIFFNKKRKSSKRYNELYIGDKKIVLC